MAPTSLIYITMLNNIKFVVPTINSENYIINFKNYYDSFNINLFFYVDKKTNDQTFEILKKNNANVKYFENNKNYVENSFSSILEDFKDFFIFRIDDDEILSPNIFKYLNKKKLLKNKVYGFKRYEVVKYDNHYYVNGPNNFIQKIYFEFLRFFGYQNIKTFINQTRTNGNTHRQYRLFFNGGKIKYSTKIHTPGLDLNKIDRINIFNDKYCIYHFVTIVQNKQKRIHKISDYEKIKKGSGMRFYYNYLPEEYFEISKKVNYFNSGFKSANSNQVEDLISIFSNICCDK